MHNEIYLDFNILVNNQLESYEKFLILGGGLAEIRLFDFKIFLKSFLGFSGIMGLLIFVLNW